MSTHNNYKAFELPQLFWPVKWGKETGLYFYLESITALRGGRVEVAGRGEMIMLSSYSYLGLLGHPEIEQEAKKAIERFSTGCHGVRLLAGTLTIHNELEKQIANFKGTEDAIVYSSGYVTNVSTISTLVNRNDYVICDKLNHASIVDGCILSGAKLLRFRHNDIDHLEKILKKLNSAANKLVIVDGVFSMDGDIVKIPDISKICHKYGALLMVDEAHSLGVLGKTGHGIEEHFGIQPDAVDIKMGTLSKTIPSVGGYIAGSKKLIELLKHQSRGFIYSAALPPAQVGAAKTAFKIIENEPERTDKLHKNIDHFKMSIDNLGFNTLNSESAIVPIVCGETETAWKMAKLCQDEGLFVQGIPHPVVPKGTARLRCILTAAHTKEDIDYCIDVILKAGQKTGVI
jgi:8-amino-7-oxononanoate synthase